VDGSVIATIDGLERTFDANGTRVVAFRDVSFQVDRGEFVTIVGPSGCGKTTLLNVIAGLLEPSRGSVQLEHDATGKRTDHIGYMFQKDLLLPWRTIRANVAFGLELQGVRKRDARRRADEMLERFGLDEFAGRYPSQLSGGMRQRAALMRTLLCGRPILLLDEPFGALDALTRSIMQEWLLQIWSQTSSTVIFITHDVEEAIFLSDRVLVMTARPGTLKAQVDIDLPRPRSYDVVTSPGFVSVKERLLRLIHEEGVKALR
jgi:ABC-type nitrate/sulfonate/bicarbonate transport system ATPase subunit